MGLVRPDAGGSIQTMKDESTELQRIPPDRQSGNLAMCTFRLKILASLGSRVFRPLV